MTPSHATPPGAIERDYHVVRVATALQRAAIVHLLMLLGRTVIAAWALGAIATQPGSEDYLYLFLGLGYGTSAAGTAFSAVLLLVGARYLKDGRPIAAWVGVVFGTLWPLVLAALVMLMFAPWFMPMQLVCAGVTAWAGTRLTRLGGQHTQE